MHQVLVRRVFISAIWLLTAASLRFALSPIAIRSSQVCLGMLNSAQLPRLLPLGIRLFFSGSIMKRAPLLVGFIFLA